MIVGIGTDIVSVGRIRGVLDRHGVRFVERILAPTEWEDYRGAAAPAQFLAKRFAAKEAAAKALGTGFRCGLVKRDIGVSHDSLGRPLLSFSGRAAELCAERGVASSWLSISDETDYAVAFVTLERE